MTQECQIIAIILKEHEPFVPLRTQLEDDPMWDLNLDKLACELAMYQHSDGEERPSCEYNLSWEILSVQNIVAPKCASLNA